MDGLEAVRRDAEIGIRCETERATPIPSSVYVLRKVEAISQVPKR